MNRTLQIVHLLVLLAVIAFLGAIGWQAWGFFGKMDAAADSAKIATDSLNASLVKINQPCIPIKGQKLTSQDDKPCGTLADVNQTLRTIRGLAGTLESAGHHEDRNLTALDEQERQLFADAHGTLVDLTTTARQATTLLATGNVAIAQLNDPKSGITPILLAANDDLGQVGSATIDLRKFLESPDVTETLANTQKITASAATITADAAYEADKYSHPPKKKLTFWSATWAGIEFIHKLEPPIF